MHRTLGRRLTRRFEWLEPRQVLSAVSPVIDVPLDYLAWQNLAYTTEAARTDSSPGDGSQPIEFDTPIVGDAPLAQDIESTTLIGLDRVQASYAYRGTGYSVAVIDTGIDYTHANLGAGWGRRVVAGYDFVNNDSDPMDDNGHGTHVAGIIGSDNATYRGVAPGVQLIALKVLGANGSGTFGNVEKALKWVAQYQSQYNIVAVNMSLGSGNYTSTPYTFLEDEFTQLKAQGVFIATSSGNSFYDYSSAQGLGYPSISPNTVAVGAVWDANVGSVTWSGGGKDNTTAADRITSFTQRSAALDMLAPGAFITNTYRGGGFATMAGTSMASPYIAGAAAIVHQALDAAGKSATANQDTILSLMKATGATIVDGDDENDNVTNTGLSFKRLNLFAAVQSAVGGTAPPSGGSGVPSLQGDGGFYAYSSAFGGGVRVALGDVTGDGRAEIIAAPGAGTTPTIRVFDAASRAQLPSPIGGFNAYAAAFTGGMYVAAGDVNGDGFDDIITGAGEGGGPHVRVFSGLDGSLLREFFAYAPNFTGGVRVAAGDVNGDGKADIITSPGQGGSPHVRVFSGANGSIISEFHAFEPIFSGGVFVAAGDVDGDGKANVIVGSGAGRTATINIYQNGDIVRSSFTVGLPATAGLTIAAGDYDGDNKADIIVGPAGGSSDVRVFSGVTLSQLATFSPYPGFSGGTFVAAGDVSGTGALSVLTGAGAGGGPHVRLWALGTSGAGLSIASLASPDARLNESRAALAIAYATSHGEPSIPFTASVETGQSENGMPHARPGGSNARMVWDSTSVVTLFTKALDQALSDGCEEGNESTAGESDSLDSLRTARSAAWANYFGAPSRQRWHFVR